MTVTSDEFIFSVKRLVTVPSTQALLEDDDILAFGTDAMRDTMIPLMTGVNEEYFVMKYAPIPIVSGTSTYLIPSRAIARKLREVKLVDSSGKTYDFPKINIERTQVYRNSSCPVGFHFLGDRVELVGDGGTGYSLLFYYPAQPGRLVSTAEAAIVAGISGNDITVNSLPTAFTVDKYMDFIESISGNGFLGIKAKVTNVSGNTLSFEAGSVPLNLSEGDYIALTGESPVLQIPDEGAPLLQSLTAYDVLGAISDFEGQDKIMKKIKTQTDNFLKLIAPRVDGEPTIIVNDRSLLRGRRNLPGRFRD